jgi:hypothetical protein
VALGRTLGLAVNQLPFQPTGTSTTQNHPLVQTRHYRMSQTLALGGKLTDKFFNFILYRGPA